MWLRCTMYITWGNLNANVLLACLGFQSVLYPAGRGTWFPLHHSLHFSILAAEFSPLLYSFSVEESFTFCVTFLMLYIIIYLYLLVLSLLPYILLKAYKSSFLQLVLLWSAFQAPFSYLI